MDNNIKTFILNRAFFGKINCLKILMNSEKEVYFHIGLLKMGNWEWKKVKMSDNELGEIINVLKNCDGACSFYHKYNDKKAQIWIKKSEKSCNVKVNDFSKNLTIGEFEVLRIILEQCIRMMNF